MTPDPSFLTRCQRTLAGLAGLLVLMTGSATVSAQTNGYHDVADCSTIAGWAWDAGQPTTPISVDIYSDTTLIGSVSAGTFRQDLQNAGIGDGNHGFQITTPAAVIDGQPHTLTVKYGGTQTTLNNTPKTISCIAPGQPTPSYEGYLDVADCTRLAGWEWDRNQPTTPITVDLYDGATLIATVSANAFRQDLLNAGKGNGSHSFDIPVPSNLIDGQGHTITAKYGGTQTSLNASPKTLSCIAPGQPTPSYEGYLDVADCTHIAGWGWDQNQATTPISIDLYEGATLIATVAASAFRQDLLNAGKGNGSHSFDIPVPSNLINGQGHTITAKYSGTQISLNASPKTLSCIAPGQPTPSYNGYHDGADCTGITGWAWDANQPTGAVSVDVYDGATRIATVAANQFRQDLVAAGIGNGLHGFQLVTPNSVKDGAPHVITLRYAGTPQTLNTTPKSLTCAPVGARLYYIYPDHLGTPRLVTDETNAIVWRNLPTTEPFGNSPVEDDPGNTGNHFQFNLRFPGQYADQESGLFYNANRDYDPSTGRYVQSDPIGLRGGINGFAYVNGNPLSRIDPLGLYCWTNAQINAAAGGLGGLVSGAAAGFVDGGIAGAIVLGGVAAATGAAAGYVGTDTAGQAGLGGATSGAFSSGKGIKGGAAGGVVGGLVTNGLTDSGMRDTQAGIVGGGIGGAAGGTVSGFLSYKALQGAWTGGVFGIAGAAVSAAVAEGLRAGNDCGCGASK